MAARKPWTALFSNSVLYRASYFSTIRPYCRMAALVVMLTASRPSDTAVTSAPMPPAWPSRRPSRSGESIWATSTRLPACTAARASAAATVVRPTPPFPERMRKRRWKRELMSLEAVLHLEPCGQPIAEQVQPLAPLGGEGRLEEVGVVELQAGVGLRRHLE